MSVGDLVLILSSIFSFKLLYESCEDDDDYVSFAFVTLLAHTNKCKMNAT